MEWLPFSCCIIHIVRHGVGYLCCLSFEYRQCESLKTWDRRSRDSHAFLVSTGEYLSIVYSREAVRQNFNSQIIMDENKKDKKNNEMQSRRAFFKKAAKSVLPLVAGGVLASAPAIAKAEKTPSGCQWDCSYSCRGGCQGCTGACTGGCSGRCLGSCTNVCTSCLTGCQGGCYSGCKGSCHYSCVFGSY